MKSPSSLRRLQRRDRDGADDLGAVFAFGRRAADSRKVRETDRRGPPARPALGALGVLLFVAALAPSVRPTAILGDFNAFYCAGRALAQGADPYRAEPLGRCERTARPAPLKVSQPGLAMPAPLPPYALAPFRVLAPLPYIAAAVIWIFLSALAVGAAVVAMRRLTGLPWVALVAAFALGDGYATLCLGQVAPVAIGAIALTAMFLADDRDELAACAAGLAMIEPHVGFPVCLSLFIWRPRARLGLAAIAVLCAVLSVTVAGAAVSIEYVRAVIPAHALSEIANEKQFSLSYLLHRFGVADGPALRAGELWYGVMLLAGIFAAERVRRRGAGNAALALIPPALAVFGGPFVHISQIAVAVPAALLLYARVAAMRHAIGVALVALAIPWVQFANLGTIFLGLAALAAAVLVASFVDARPSRIAAGACAAAAFVAIAIALVQPIPDVQRLLVAAYDPAALAEASWQRYVIAIGTANATAFDLAKLPTIAALMTLVSVVLRAAFRTMETRHVTFLASGEKGAVVPRRIAH